MKCHAAITLLSAEYKLMHNRSGASKTQSLWMETYVYGLSNVEHYAYGSLCPTPGTGHEMICSNEWCNANGFYGTAKMWNQLMHVLYGNTACIEEQYGP